MERSERVGVGVVVVRGFQAFAPPQPSAETVEEELLSFEVMSVWKSMHATCVLASANTN